MFKIAQIIGTAFFAAVAFRIAGAALDEVLENVVVKSKAKAKAETETETETKEKSV